MSHVASDISNDQHRDELRRRAEFNKESERLRAQYVANTSRACMQLDSAIDSALKSLDSVHCLQIMNTKFLTVAAPEDPLIDNGRSLYRHGRNGTEARYVFVNVNAF